MKKIKRKITAVLVLLCLAVCAFAGCAVKEETDSVRIGSMKGPTSMGLLFLMEKAETEKLNNEYEFLMTSTADELLPMFIKGEVDIALVPANVASVLYQKTKGGVSVIDINTLGVLYLVSGTEDGISVLSDLKGKTIYLTGKGTTPDYVLQYLLQKNGFKEDEYTLEYKSEATEVAALLAENPEAIGLLPQPFAAAACAQNETLSVLFDMNQEWEKVQGETGGSLVTGVAIVKKEFLEENEDVVRNFLSEHEKSIAAINADVKKGAELAAKAGIVAKAPIAEAAIPECSITYLAGEDMKQALSDYLEILYGQNPEMVGGALPGEDFYYRSVQK